MTSSPALQLLDERVQVAISRLGWKALNPLQELAIPLILQQSKSAVFCAPTSGGKTEAVFLPTLSHVVANPAPSFQILSISPLKALINDQYERLVAMTKGLNVHVHRWHGDVDQDRKRALRRNPSGVLITTPESLESSFINFSQCVPLLCRHLRFVVIDELHIFLNSERGIHLRSLLSRLFDSIGFRPRCFGLSATLADPKAAALYINPDAPDSVAIVQDSSNEKPIQVSVATMTGQMRRGGEENSNSGRTGGSGLLSQIGKDVASIFQDSTNLIFTNNRRTVEMLADYMRERAEIEESNSGFYLHHGSLSAQARRNTELALKNGGPANAICTNSLELGIDIGAIATVAQIDPPWKVSSLVQRLGRSGRREGQTRILKLYVRSIWPNEKSCLSDHLFPELLQSIAMVNLLLRGWLEPLATKRTHLSTLVHQILSTIKETGCVAAPKLYESLCVRGPFRNVTVPHFRILLEGLYRSQLIDQGDERELFLGLTGEQIASSPDFYAAFDVPPEFNVRFRASPIGKLPWSFGIKTGECVVLNGKRWIIDEIQWRCRTIWVTPSRGKKAPVFRGEGGEIDTEIFKEMRRMLDSTVQPTWLDTEGQEQLTAGRKVAEEVGLLEQDVVDAEGEIHWFPWVGTRASITLNLWATHQHIECSRGFLSLSYPGLSKPDLQRHLSDLIQGEVDPTELADLLPMKQFEKFDKYVDERLLTMVNATDRLDLAGAKAAAEKTLAQLNTRGAVAASR